MNNKCSDNSLSSSSCSSSSSSYEHNPVVKDLLAALEDEELHDTTIIASDGTPIKASRFVLAARSLVWKKMLYGPFLESKSSTVSLAYTAEVLQGALEYCATNEIVKFAQSQSLLPQQQPDDELLLASSSSSMKSLSPSSSFRVSGGCPVSVLAARKLVQLAKLGDFLGLAGLLKKAEKLVRSLIMRYPSLACPIYDEASSESDIQLVALHMIECRPYVALVPSQRHGPGGVECLSPDNLLEILRNPNVKTGELFLFDMLRRWVNASPDVVSAACTSSTTPEERRQAAKDCGRYLELDNIEPKELLGGVKKSGLVDFDRIQEAITLQALRASKHRVWSISCRGPRTNVDRILVEGAGAADANGIYYRIEGLSHGEVYSKREMNSCGQPYVYTMSCSYNHEQGEVECRIFCSKLLTHRALSKFKRMKTPDPNFQPVLQIIQIMKKKDMPQATRVLVSDGEYYIQGTVSDDVAKMLRRKEIRVNSLIKITDVGKYKLDGRTAIHINQLSLVSFDPGNVFGSPINILDRSSSSSSKENKVDDNSIGGGLRRLYSHHYPKSDANNNSTNNNNNTSGNIPRSGWKVECHGEGPGPTCTWIPATKERRKSSSHHRSMMTASLQLAEISPSDSDDDDEDDDDDISAHNQANYVWKLDRRRSIVGGE